MKHILFFAVITLVGLVSSCKKDPAEAEPTPQELIVGKWQATKAVLAGNDIIIPTTTTKTDLEIEFMQNGTIAFNYTTTLLNTTPPGIFKSTLNGTYSWNGDIITINAQNGTDIRSVTGTIVITKTNLVFTATSGDIADFLGKLEADKI